MTSTYRHKTHAWTQQMWDSHFWDPSLGSHSSIEWGVTCHERDPNLGIARGGIGRAPRPTCPRVGLRPTSATGRSGSNERT